VINIENIKFSNLAGGDRKFREGEIVFIKERAKK